uniref:exodeoxyribonuclease V subunit gamma n=1 Tax=Gordonia sp. B7-2 TaxID=3420932 RepID=UPI003D94703A
MLFLHRAERTDTLADALADLIATPLADPMQAEIVSVPAVGVERWLQQHLARRLGCGPSNADGIAANIDFSSPSHLVDTIVAAVQGDAATEPRLPVDEPWRAAALVWPVLRVLDRRITDPALAVIARHIGAGDDASPRVGRRFATARHLADLFERYGRTRPSMVAAWANGRDEDGAGGPIASDLKWQPDFWRALRDEIGRPHPAESLPQLCERLRDDPAAGGLPERFSIFGPTRITEEFRQVIVAASHHHDVHLFLPHPSPALWDALAAVVDPDATAPPRRTDRPEVPVGHPLLASLSRDVQELQARLLPSADEDIHHAARSAAPRTLLGALQTGLRDDRLEDSAVQPDSSVEIHACHGPERQVEVLRDRLLHLFAADPTLQPRDVLVMCPDVETFAPLIRGAFGQAGLSHPAFALRVRLADRTIRRVNPILDVVAAVVELAASRVRAGEVIDLIGHEPVRRRFAFTDSEVDRLREWLATGNIRWGIDVDQRARFGLVGFGQGTFESGLDRITLGAVAEEQDGEWLGTALPLAGVESTEIDLAGRFAELMARLSAVLDELSGSAPAARWREALIDIVDTMTTTDPVDDWQRAQTIRLITEAFGEDRDSDNGDGATLLRLPDVRDLISALVAGRPTRSNFRTGELTVCTMVPMRSVPHRVIVLLGIDAEVFPRVQRVDGDDVLGTDPLVGERNPRDEDRQCFLDAMCAAGESLLVFYSGADPVSGRRIPPAVVVSELVDTVSTLIDADEDPVRHHTLHGFDRRNFIAGALPGVAAPFSHDAALLEGALALRDPTEATRPMAAAEPLDEAAADPAETDIDLDALIDFHVDTIAGFLRQRLGTRVPREERAHDDQLDVALDPLEAWGIGDRFLSRMLTGATIEECQAAELRRGTLPPFAFGTRTLSRISQVAQNLHQAVADVRTGSPAMLDIDVTLPDGRRVFGTVPNVFGTRLVTATYSRLKAKALITEWIRIVAVAAGAASGSVPAGRMTTGIVVGRAVGGAGAARVTFTPPDDAVATLHDLVRIRDEGLRTPLPLPLDAAQAFAQHDAGGRRREWGLRAAERSFADRYGAHRDPSVRLVLGGDVLATVAFDDVIVRRPADATVADALDLDPEEPLFCGLARRIWQPLLERAEGIR